MPNTLTSATSEPPVNTPKSPVAIGEPSSANRTVYGIFCGRRWRDLVCPRVRDFIASHHKPARSTGNAA
jgi:poly-beta-hydroxyalkanoate depolymerase